MSLSFRNIEVDPAAPVESWGFEGVLAALDRGDLGDWSRVLRAAERDPWGPVAKQLAAAAEATEDRGAGAWARLALAHVRSEAAVAERAEVARELTALVAASGVSQGKFAEHTGTSASRLSTYLTAKVCPSAAFMVRARRVANLLR